MKSVLVICPFEQIYPPLVGGAQRFFHIIHQLARFFRVTVVINQDKASFIKSADKFPAMKNVTVHSTQGYHYRDAFTLFPRKVELALRYRWLKKNLFATADGNYLKYYPVVKKVLAKEKFDIILLENIATLNAVPLLRKLGKGAKIIYNAHNVDSHLANVGMHKWGGKKEEYEQILQAEKSFCKKVDAVIACSEKDKKELADLNEGKLLIGVVPNGVDIPGQMAGNGESSTVKDILFCGALWTLPNSEGLHWFAAEIWPHILASFPGLKLLVVGSGQLPERYSELKKISSFNFIGAVPDVAPWYAKASLVVVPLLSGSGTRLKVLEAMGMGMPIVSTAKGAEGINYHNEKDILIKDNPVEFAGAVVALLQNADKRKTLGQNARSLAGENYDWNVIGENMARFINDNL